MLDYEPVSSHQAQAFVSDKWGPRPPGRGGPFEGETRDRLLGARRIIERSSAGPQPLGARASRPHPVPAVGRCIGQPQGKQRRRCRLIQVGERDGAAPGLVRAGRPRSQERISLKSQSTINSRPRCQVVPVADYLSPFVALRRPSCPFVDNSFFVSGKPGPRPHDGADHPRVKQVLFQARMPVPPSKSSESSHRGHRLTRRFSKNQP